LKHHKYDNGICGNDDPIACSDMEKPYGVPKATASRYFKKYFGSHNGYVIKCRDKGTLAAFLKILTGEFSLARPNVDPRRDAEENGDDE